MTSSVTAIVVASMVDIGHNPIIVVALMIKAYPVPELDVFMLVVGTREQTGGVEF